MRLINVIGCTSLKVRKVWLSSSLLPQAPFWGGSQLCWGDTVERDQGCKGCFFVKNTETLQYLLTYSNYQVIIASVMCTNNPSLPPIGFFFCSKCHIALHYFFQPRCTSKLTAYVSHCLLQPQAKRHMLACTSELSVWKTRFSWHLNSL